MKKTYLGIVLKHVGITQAELARRVGWTPARVNYLVSPDCVGFPFSELWRIKGALRLSDRDQVAILNEYFAQYGNDGRSGNR